MTIKENRPGGFGNHKTHESHLNTDEKDQPIVLVSNPELRRLVQALQYAKIDWEKIFDNYFNEQFEAQRGLHSMQRGSIAEIALRYLLKKHCLASQKLQADPIPDESKTVNYRFKYDKKGGLGVFSRERGIQVTEYDATVLVDDLPVVFEVKMSGKTTNGCLYDALKPNKVLGKVGPLAEYFGKNEFGYVVATPSDLMREVDPYQVRFKAYGGILLPFFGSRQEYNRMISALKEDYSLTIFRRT